MYTFLPEDKTQESQEAPGGISAAYGKPCFDGGNDRMRERSVSVVMATYNGEKYVREQIESIVSQLKERDELLISDDGSTDGTVCIIRTCQSRYPQIVFLRGPGKGVFLNFFHALEHCRNEIVYLSDQDDIWMPGKIEAVNALFADPAVKLVLHNGVHFGKKGADRRMIPHYRRGVLKNILMSSYWGCCMAFRRSFIEKYLPVRFRGIAHDQLIGVLAEKERCSVFLDRDLIRHREHGGNLTKKRPLAERVIFRIRLFSDFMRASTGAVRRPVAVGYRPGVRGIGK